MTNAEKFVEVFGTDLKRQYSTKSWWDQEFVPTLNNNCKEIADELDVLDKIREEFISLYPKNYAGELELGGFSCVFSLHKVLNIIDKYREPTGAESEE